MTYWPETAVKGNMDIDNQVIAKNYIDGVTAALADIDTGAVIGIYEKIAAVAASGGRIYLCGNGGSASTASHFQNDLNKAFSVTRGIMPACCLADNLSAVTAISNDISYSDVFLYQLRFMLRKQDLLVVISGSGNSANVVKAAEYARSLGCPVISLTGFDGGRLLPLSDFSFHAPVNNMQISEDLHLMCCHLVATMILKTGPRSGAGRSMKPDDHAAMLPEEGLSHA